MPYKSSDVPSGTEKVPEHGQAIYRAAFNAACEKYGEERAHAVAWAAVKRKYKKKGESWVSRDGDSVMRALGDKEFSSERRGELAKSGKAMSGGGFPIENEADLKNAIQAFGRAKNKGAAKAHIKKRARALGKTELLPENWDGMDEAALLLRDVWITTEDEYDARRKPPDEDDEDDEDEDDIGDARVRLVDSFVMDGVRKTRDGYLVANARIARTGIQLYTGDELGAPHMPQVRVWRPPEEVFSKKAMHSLAHRPITLTHPPEMVDAANWSKYAVGHTGDEVTRDGDCVRVPMVIMDSRAIEAFERYGVKQNSVGYSTELRWGEGKTPDGEVYDAVQTAIRGNHLAVVPAARGGSRLRIGDDHQKGDTNMVRILINDQSLEFNDEHSAKFVQALVASLQKSLADAKKKNDDDAAEKEQEEEKRTRAEKDAAALKGEVAALKKQLEDAVAKLSSKSIDEIVKERTDLLLKADAVMDGKVNFDGKEPSEIRRIVVLAKMGETAKDLTDAEVVGAFKILTANIKPRSGVGRLADSLSSLSLGGGGNQNDPRAIKDAAYEEHLKHLSNAWRPAART